jgi:hypothetical protein
MISRKKVGQLIQELKNASEKDVKDDHSATQALLSLFSLLFDVSGKRKGSISRVAAILDQDAFLEYIIEHLPLYPCGLRFFVVVLFKYQKAHFWWI